MQLAQLGIQNTFPNRFNPFMVAIYGDSNSNGAASTITPCAAGTLYNFNGTTYDEITTQSVANSFPLLGSIWQPYATAFKAAFGRPIGLINNGKGGTYFSNDVAANSWGSSGNLRGDAAIKNANGLAAAGKSVLDLIIVNMGINDIRNSYTAGAVATAVDNFFSYITTTYPGVPVLVIQQGRSESALNGALYYNLRKALIDAAITYTDVNIVCQAMPLAFISGAMEADNLHYSATGQGLIANQIVRWQLRTTLSKWARSLTSSLYEDLTSARDTLIDNFMISQVANLNYFRFEGLFNWRIGTANSCLVDWSHIGYGAFGGTPTLTANDCLTFNGSNQYFATGILSDIYDGRGSDANNVTVGCRVKANRSAGTTALFGSVDAAGSLSIVQNGVRYRVNDLTLSAGTDTVLQANTTYTVRRENGTTKRLLKNKTSNASATQANTGQIDTYSQVIAAIQSSGGITSHTDCDLIYYFYAGYTNFDYDSFYDAMDTLITNW